MTAGSDAIVYCGSGVATCHDLLALELIGVNAATLYPGAWSAWSADRGRAVALGEEPSTQSSTNVEDIGKGVDA